MPNPLARPRAELRVAVIGAGPSGLVAGRELLAQGFSNFTIFEKAPAVGGTWQQHSYPGLACDVKAAAYTFSKAPNPGWSHSFVEQPEIRDYLQRSAHDFGLEPHLQLDTEIVSARYQAEGQWQIQTADGECVEFDIVINAMGNQHTPLFPDIEGLERFRGDWWHSTEWNHDVPLEGRRIAVVGSAADPTSRYNGCADEALPAWASGARAGRTQAEAAARSKGRLSSVLARLSASRHAGGWQLRAGYRAP